MSNAFMGQRQQASPMGFGGYSGGYDPFGGGGYGGGMGGFGNYSPQPQPYNPAAGRGFGDGGIGGFGTTFGNFGMGGGGGFGGGMRAPAYEPTINDAFSRYFSQQYYGGPAFDPFAATSFFGGGYGGGFGFGGGGRRGGGMGGRMRRRRQMFEDLFQPEQPPQPQPMPIGGGAAMPTTGGGGVQMGGNMGEAVAVTPDQLRGGAAHEVSLLREEARRSRGGGGGYSIATGAPTPQPYMGGFSFPFDQALPAKSEAPSAPAVQGFDSIMPVQMQDTPVQSAPAYAPAPYTPPAPTYTEPMQYTPPAPSYAEPIQYIPPAPSYMEPEQYIPLNIAPRFSPFARSSREMLELDF